MKFSPSSRSAIQPDAGITYNYDETQIPPHTLPDPLVSADGMKIPDASTWIEKRRPELLHLFETQMYGRSPGKPGGMQFEVTATDPRALDGKATRKEVTVYFTGDKAGPSMNLLIVQPNGIQKPLPNLRTLRQGRAGRRRHAEDQPAGRGISSPLPTAIFRETGPPPSLPLQERLRRRPYLAGVTFSNSAMNALGPPGM